MFRGLKTAINGACKYAACHALINLYFGRFCHKVFSHYHQRSAGIIFVIILYHRIIPIESSHLFFFESTPCSHLVFLYDCVIREIRSIQATFLWQHIGSQKSDSSYPTENKDNKTL